MEIQASRVKVAVRIRPLSSKELQQGGSKVVSAARKAQDIVLPGRDGELVSHGFDQAFDSNVSQSTVYDEMAKPLMDHVMAGFNATVLAYGQTGSGKTFTMGM
jgi:hypothetical protein